MKRYRVRYLPEASIFITIDDALQLVYVIDVVHTARQTKLDEHRDV